MKKILFIEDQPALQKALGRILEEEGYKTLSALDGETGIRIAQKELPDLVLLDLILPRKDGFTILKELKSDAKTKAIPIVILTNLERGEDVDQALALGATTYLVKTYYRLDEVVKKIKEIIG